VSEAVSPQFRVIDEHSSALVATCRALLYVSPATVTQRSHSKLAWSAARPAMNTVSRLHTSRMIAKCDERLSTHDNAPSNVVRQRFSTPIGVELATIPDGTDSKVSTNERDDDHRRRCNDRRRAGRADLRGAQLRSMA
jgi:hypothetical protein